MSLTAESPFEIRDVRQPLRAIDFGAGARSSCLTTAPTSPEIAESTLTFLLNSAGSISTWIFLALRRVGFEVAGDPIVEAHAERDQEVGFLNRRVHPGLAVHAHHAEIQRMRRRKQPMPSSVIATWNLRLFPAKRLKNRSRATEDDAVARRESADAARR
jgi:hypothetical protein